MLRSYCQQTNGAHTIFNDFNYYYVYRNRHRTNEGEYPLVYTQKCNGSGEIHIYQLIEWTLNTFEATELMP